MEVLGICLWLAAAPAGGTPVFLPTEQFTLAWVHSIEKVRWEEDYAVVRSSQPGQPPRLRADKARIRGSAAGMEPPEGAIWREGWFEYQAAETPAQGLHLTRSEFTADYEWCAQGVCVPLSQWLPSDGAVTRLQACTAGDAASARLRHP